MPRLLRTTALLFAILLGLPALATVAIRTSVEQLTRGSDAVIRGRVLSREARVSGDGLRINTWVRIRREATWTGSAGEEVLVVTPGGEVGEIGQKVHGAPTFEDGEEVVLFLRREGTSFQVNGLAMGKFRVEGRIARPSLEGMRVIDPEPRSRPGERAVEPMSLEELERRVKAARP